MFFKDLLFHQQPAKKHGAIPRFFQNHFKEGRKNPAKYTHRSPVQGIQKKHAKNALSKTELLETQTRTLQKSSVAPLYRASKEGCTSTLWLMYEVTYTNIADCLENIFFTNNQQETYTLKYQALPKRGLEAPCQNCLVAQGPAGTEFLGLYVSTPSPPHPLYSHFVRRVKLRLAYRLAFVTSKQGWFIGIYRVSQQS